MMISVQTGDKLKDAPDFLRGFADELNSATPAPMTDPYDLSRFVEAQRVSYDEALAEIRMAAKRGHWMWFVFPQLAGLGKSDIARRFSIGSLAEAQAYLGDPVLGARLRTCVEALAQLPDMSAEAIFGQVDAMKLRSCLTLFAHADRGELFDEALARWFGSADPQTEALLSLP